MQINLRLRIISLGLLTMILSEKIEAQDVVKTISEIKFNGKKNSNAKYLKSNLLTQPGEESIETTLDQDVQRLKNLVNINDASYSLDTIDEDVILTFDIEEVRTLIPIFNSGIVEGNAFLQLGFADINWKGKGQQLSAVYQMNDGRHGGEVYFAVPRIKNGNWGLNGSISKWASREPLFFGEDEVLYNYDNDGLSISAIHHLNYNQNIQFGATYFVETYNKVSDPVTDFIGPLFLQQTKWLTKFIFNHNKIDYHFFYQSGHKYFTNFQTVYNTLDQSVFVSFQYEASSYMRIGKKGNFANRIKLGIATNNDSPFAPFVADSHVNIRGIGNRIDRGTAQVVINTEYRHTLSFKKKWAVQLTGFADVGTWRNPGGELKDLVNPDQFRLFVGGGVRFIYHQIYGAVLRIDYGIDTFNPNQRGLVIGLGQYF